MPFTVTCTWEAPPSTAAMVFATASPKSLWQWTSIGQSTSRSIRVMRCFMAVGVITPTVSGTLMIVAPASTATR